MRQQVHLTSPFDYGQAEQLALSEDEGKPIALTKRYEMRQELIEVQNGVLVILSGIDE